MDELNKRARKRARQEREAAEAAHDFRYGVLVAEALRTPGAFGPSGEGLVDAEVIPDFSGRAGANVRVVDFCDTRTRPSR